MFENKLTKCSISTFLLQNIINLKTSVACSYIPLNALFISKYENIKLNNRLEMTQISWQLYFCCEYPIFAKRAEGNIMARNKSVRCWSKFCQIFNPCLQDGVHANLVNVKMSNLLGVRQYFTINIRHCLSRDCLM